MTLRSLEVLQFNHGVAPTRIPSTDGVMALALADGVAEVIVIPANASYVRLAGQKDMFVTFGSTAAAAAVPGDTTDGSASELLPYSKGEHWRFFRQGTSGVTGLSVISSSAQVVTATFYKE